jgi:ketosteroid isomerase-like protein
MKTIAAVFFVLGLLLFAFASDDHKNDTENAKKEIMDTEQRFAQLCKKEGVEAAFVTYAADDAVIHRNDKILKGKVEIKAFYTNRFKKGSSLDWVPDFVDVSASCDLGYTYGHYTFTSVDSTGKTKESKGIFHTVWKKQKSGEWRFVWD